MEKQAESMLKAQASRLEHYPVLKARIEQHFDETISQQKLLEGCLDRLGSSPSTIKDLAGKIAAMGQAVGGMTVTDEVVKGAMAGYVFEHFEVASYTALIAAAKTAGDVETLRCCETILPQEQEMARLAARTYARSRHRLSGTFESRGRRQAVKRRRGVKVSPS